MGDLATGILFDVSESPDEKTPAFDPFDLLLAGVSDQRVPILGQVAAVATPGQVAALREAQRSSRLGTDARATIRAVLAEWERLADRSRPEPNAAPGRRRE